MCQATLLSMSTIREIEEAVRRLAKPELAEFRRWFADFDAALWDAQVEEDSRAGRLDALIDEARQDAKNGRATDL